MATKKKKAKAAIPKGPKISKNDVQAVLKQALKIPRKDHMAILKAMDSQEKKHEPADMQIEITGKVKPNPVIIEGFPGIGFVSTISVEYLADHLKVKQIGRIWSDALAPMAMIHGREVVDPIGILYDEKNNLVILEAVSGVAGLEWEIAEALKLLYKKLGAKEIISIEGIGAPAVTEKEPEAYYFTTDSKKSKIFKSIGVHPIIEGVIFGVSGALMLRGLEDMNATFIFAETHSKLPDSKAAAKIIEILDKYLDLNIDYRPLLKRATEMEVKIKELLGKTTDAKLLKQEKDKTPYIS